MHHSRIRMDCYWTYLTLWFDILNRTQLIMGSPGSIVTWCPMKNSTSTSPSISPIAIPQKAHNSMLQKAWSCSRIPEACIVILPMGLVMRHFIFLTPTPPTPSDLLDCAAQVVGLFVLQRGHFPLKAGWCQCHSVYGAVFVDLECVASRTQTGLLGTVFPFSVVTNTRCSNFLLLWSRIPCHASDR